MKSIRLFVNTLCTASLLAFATACCHTECNESTSSDTTTDITIIASQQPSMVNWDTIAVQHISNYKGGEKELVAQIYDDGPTRILKATMPSGSSVGLHTHTGSCEVVMVTKGKGMIIYDGDTINVQAGQVHYCGEGHSHSIINNSDAEISVLNVITTL